MRIEVAELTPHALDAVRADALAVFVGPTRPPQGLAALADWRLCGALTRALRSGHYLGAEGEQLLLPTGGRLPIPRVFCFGLPTPPDGEVSFRAVAYRTLDTLLRAGSRIHAVSLPPVASGGPAPDQAARLWLEATLRFPPERQVLLGDAPSLRRDLGAARDALQAGVEVAAADLAATLLGSSAVVR